MLRGSGLLHICQQGHCDLFPRVLWSERMAFWTDKIRMIRLMMLKIMGIWMTTLMTIMMVAIVTMMMMVTMMTMEEFVRTQRRSIQKPSQHKHSKKKGAILGKLWRKCNAMMMNKKITLVATNLSPFQRTYNFQAYKCTIRPTCASCCALLHGSNCSIPNVQKTTTKQQQ